MLDAAMMRVRFLAALVLVAVPAALPAQAAERFGEGLLWRIEGKGAAPSHVLGTIHLADSRVTKLPPPVEREFKGARSLTIEAGLDPGNLVAVVNRMVYSDGRSLPAVAGDDLYKRAVALTDSLGLPEPLARQFKPWALALMLSSPQQDPSSVLDYMLARMAQEQGKTVLELESLDEQASIFDEMSEADQVALLRHAVTHYGRLAKDTARLTDVYLKRDLSAMWRISEESSSTSADAKRVNEVFAQRLIFDRNTRMVERMQPTLGQGRAFIAIGALHLYGDRGVLALLERQGYKVTRVY
ncbi:MAG TPA: TraB/GumN family protein [Burkholderiales bacterium]|nr:TraB/GumN family protein [Burkholderiales bacterium]